MKRYGILVVDDSAFMRRAISQILEGDPRFHVVGIARNGVDAVEKVQRLRPDLVTMDVEMPEMNGIQALEQIMKISPVPVVMLSSHTGEGARETLQSLELGAVDFFLKDNLLKNPKDSHQISEFLQRLRAIVNGKLPSTAPTKSPQVQVKKVKRINPRQFELLFIGCSTGGPSALQKILPYFPEDFPIPIVVAQHMPPKFTKPLADRFDTLCQLKVREAQHEEVLSAGSIYIAPSGYQTRLKNREDGSILFTIDDQTDDQVLYKPCIDITLASIAPIYKHRLLTVILTGMGSDGMQGCGLVKKNNGTVLVEAEESCVVYGMPKSVYEAGYADGQFELTQMFHQIRALI
ncbi:chemotaxis response regulator protein-glutamate methylesterase [Neobacillus sp. MM2021_6]|uniref:protein-glutamate methylesterase/protein-glutamine glutaminase n=1 Tax=Bacillaceae TaxID=186817 RepID=UPI00140C5817|nr:MULTISPECIES: chemotaxis response regulator protein-glutamate methylesterase [Bacillaceae]MBO0961808.1 chemotaxis response regulator protein-glutamate methylesterase [Neobacillus sp. MM2021_6]NHC21093.1 chemotaxis response regulator protein-glutamate methylesterase [Bacillus sp. MM2020_4]